MTGLKNITKSPKKYEEAAVIAKEAGLEMLRRLEWMTLKPKVIVDMGCGPGVMSEHLQTYYPEAQVIALDYSEAMLEHAKSRGMQSMCADAARLPLQDQSVDFIFANFLLPWHVDYPRLLSEWRRVLRPEGLLMLSALGLDTLKEWREISADLVLPRYVDMHELGDLLLQQRFSDPVLDVDYYTATYRDQTKLYAELCASEIISECSFVEGERKSQPDCLEVTYEIIFAHAFAPAPLDTFPASQDGETKVPLAHLRKRHGVKV